MNEELKNEVVEKAFDELTEKAEALDKAIAETGVKPASALTELASNKTTGGTIAITAGCTLLGIGGGIALDHWVFPWASKTINAAVEKHKAKKAEKKAKKAAKKAQTAAPEKPAASNEVPADQNSEKNED